MSSRRSFLDTDNSIMERNLRFVKNDLEENLNQYFGGSSTRGNSSTNISAPPRDYKVVQPKPDGTHDYAQLSGLEKRRNFLLNLGLARHVAYDLAKTTDFDVIRLQQKYNEYVDGGLRKVEIMSKILTDIRGNKNPIENVTHREQGTSNPVIPKPYVYAPGYASRQAAGAPIQKTNSLEDCNLRWLHAGSLKPNTYKAPEVRTDNRSVEMLSSGAGKAVLTHTTTNPASFVPKNVLSKASPPASTEIMSKPRHITPARRAFLTRRSAYRKISQLRGKSAEELTEKEKRYLDWAITHIAGLKTICTPAEEGVTDLPDTKYKETSGSANRQAPNMSKNATKPLDGRNLSLVHVGSLKPSTSKATQVRTDTRSVEIAASGAGKAMQTQSTTNTASFVPKSVNGEHSKNDSVLYKASLAVSNTSLSTPRHKSPSQRAFSQRRAAHKILSRLGSRPIEELTEQEISSLDWAKSITAGLKSVPPSAEESVPTRSQSNAAPKRQQSVEDKVAETKRSRNMPAQLTDSSFKKMAKDHFIWAIIDRSASDGTISSRNWRNVINALSGEFLRFVRMNPGPPPQCTDVGWYQGHIKLIACADERSAQLYKTVVESLGEVWPGARLKAIPLADVPQMPRSVAKIPAVPSDPKEILEILRTSNPQLPTNDWKVVKVTEPKDGFRKATFIINSDSLPLLKRTHGKIFYALGNIFLHVYKGYNNDLKQSAVAVPEQVSANDMESSDFSFANEDPQMTKSYVDKFCGRFNVMGEDKDILLGEDDDNPEDADITVLHSDEL